MKWEPIEPYSDHYPSVLNSTARVLFSPRGFYDFSRQLDKYFLDKEGVKTRNVYAGIVLDVLKWPIYGLITWQLIKNFL